MPLLAITLALSMSGCSDRSHETGELSPGKYVALFEMVSDGYSVIEGETFHPPMMAPAPPLFDYDGSQGRIRDYTPINDSLKILYGTFYFTNDASRKRGLLNVTGIYSFPFSPEYNLTINRVDENGTVYMSYNGELINLTTGELWTSPVIDTWVETRDYNTSITSYVNGTTPEVIPVHVYYKLRWTTSFYVQNRGIFNKSDIK